MKPVLLGIPYRDKLDEPLRKLGLDPLYIPENPNIDPRLSGHADLSVFQKGERIWLAPYLAGTDLPDILRNFGYDVIFANISQAKEYPFDASLNFCSVGKQLLVAKHVHDSNIVNYLTIAEGLYPIWIRQGYARCSCCVIDGESLITADRGIASACEAAGIQVLLIRPGFVELAGFSHGFLGGACFHLDETSIAFTGSLHHHPDSRRILSFLQNRGVRAVSLTEGPLFDIGGAFVLQSKN